MNLAYVILCHKNAPQVGRLIERLQYPGAAIVLHISKTSDAGFYKAMQAEVRSKNYANVFFCKREDGTHNGFGIVKGFMNALGYLLDNNIPFDYVSLISGQDYPIKPMAEIAAFFEKNKGKQFFDFFPLFPKEDTKYGYNNFWGPGRQHYRVNRYHFKINGVVRSIPEIETERLVEYPLLPTIKTFIQHAKRYWAKGRLSTECKLLFWSRVLPHRRKIPTEFEIFGGKTWWSITKDAAVYIVDTHKNNKKYPHFFRYTLIPDEMYIHTILMNSSFEDQCVNNDLRVIEWEPGDMHPIIIKAKHIDWFTKPTDKIFARKFDTEVDSKILDLIDEQVLYYKK